MNQYPDIDIKKILIVAVVEFVLVIGLSLFFSQPRPLILGVLFGFLLSVLNFRLLYLTLSKAVKMQPRKAQVYTSTQYMIRYIIVGVCIFISIKAPYINVIGTIIGLFIVKTAIFFCALISSVDLFQNTLMRRK